MHFIVYARRGDTQAASIVAQIRMLLSSRLIQGHVQLIEEPEQLRLNGVLQTPTVTLDGTYISCGYTPSRTELEMAIDRRTQALALSRNVFESRGDTRHWRR